MRLPIPQHSPFRVVLPALLAVAALAAMAAPSAAQAPNPPVGGSAQVGGSAARLTWSPPNGGATVLGYEIDAGTSSGASNLVAGYQVGNVLTIDTPALPAGTYFVRIRARNNVGVSPPSTEFAFSIGGAPTPPINLAASLSGARLTLTWGAPTNGATPTNYLIDAGSAPLTNNIVAGYPIGPAIGFSYDLPPGTYHIRLRASNGTGTSAYSNEVTVSVGGTGQPAPPSNFDYTILGGLVQLRWTAGATGGAPNGYILQVGTGSGLQNVLVQDVGNVTSLNVQAPVDGSFYVRVLAYNNTGTSGPSNERVVTLYPSACARGAFVATLVWDTGAIGQPSVDMDLHVVEPPAQEVYYGNRIGLTTQLDRDNVIGLGPENICSRIDNQNVPIPPSTGVYQIYAHAYGGSVWPTTARITVRSYVGTPQETYRVIERVFTAPTQRLNFATVTFPAGTISEVTGPRLFDSSSGEEMAITPLKVPEPKQ
ncbi:MAG: hypothetical protein ABI880_12865 [Acidobacteriota bacterium]